MSRLSPTCLSPLSWTHTSTHGRSTILSLPGHTQAHTVNNCHFRIHKDLFDHFLNTFSVKAREEHHTRVLLSFPGHTQAHPGYFLHHYRPPPSSYLLNTFSVKARESIPRQGGAFPGQGGAFPGAFPGREEHFLGPQDAKWHSRTHSASQDAFWVCCRVIVK